MIPQVIVGAIGVGISGVIAVALVIYLCCFKQRRLNPNQRRERDMRKPAAKKGKGNYDWNETLFGHKFVV